MIPRVAALLGASLALACTADAVAQNRSPSSRPAPSQAKPDAKPSQPEPPPEEPPPPAYEKELLRLSEIIGSLAFLRNLCGEADAAEWQKRMQALVDSEGTTAGRRERLAGAYNRGYQGFALTYRTCTPSALEATRRYLAEGEKLSRLLAGRYGG